MYFHPEQLPSAVKRFVWSCSDVRVSREIYRYQDEILRVFSVLDNVLAKQEWCARVISSVIL